MSKSTKICNGPVCCGNPKPLGDFHLCSSNRDGRQNWCRECQSYYRKQKYRENKESFKRKSKLYRRTPRGRALYLLGNYKREDLKRGLSNDLDYDSVFEAIQKPCVYCGEVDFTRIGLDRIDDKSGHLQTNCVPACSVCHWIKSRLPLVCFEFLLPTIIEIKNKGLFGDWKGFPH